jgi:hypothetical protein
LEFLVDAREIPFDFPLGFARGFGKAGQALAPLEKTRGLWDDSLEKGNYGSLKLTVIWVSMAMGWPLRR